MITRALLTLLCLAGVAGAASPGGAYAAAARDIGKVPHHERLYTRYLLLDAVPPAKRADWATVIDLVLNGFSREHDLEPARRVRPDLLRVNLALYASDKKDLEGRLVKAWERLADADPYLHVRVPHGGKKVAALAPWLEPAFSRLLAYRTGSLVPAVRGDWWVVQVLQAAERDGAGYYDFLGVKSRADAERLAGLARRLAEERKAEVHAAVARSSVTLHNRQIRRLATVGGFWWESRDAATNVGRQNALRNLDNKFKHDAEEIYFQLVNGLLAFHLNNAAGVQQPTAPDNIASDSKAPGTDRRVHVGISCIRCHIEGIRPIRDWTRRAYRNGVGLGSLDFEEFKRLKRLYLSDLERWVRADQASYAAALAQLTGRKPQEAANTLATLHASYQEADLFLPDIARETGYSVLEVKNTLWRVLKATPPLDPVFAGLLHEKDPEPVRREHFEEAFPVIMTYLAGLLPADRAVQPKRKP